MKLSSRDAKLSSWVAAELSMVVAMAELTLVVAAVKLYAVVVEMTQVAIVVVAATEVAVVVVTSLNWKIQSLPRQTRCPTCIIGCDSQCSFHVSIHHSLQGIPPCFYGGQVLPYPHVL
jgi:hypothetical protein